MWKDICIESKYIGETIVKGSGWYEKEYVHVYVPGPKYEKYCFLLSKKCYYPAEHIGGKCIAKECISLETSMKLELFVAPEHREPGKKYKRYHMSAGELIEEVFEPYEDELHERENAEIARKNKERERRYKKIIGDTVYGRYQGSLYDEADSFSAFYFSNDGVYYGNLHQKVRNVLVEEVFFRNVSKYFYEKNLDLIKERLAEWRIVKSAIVELERIENYDTEHMVNELKVYQEKIINNLYSDLDYKG